MEYPVNSDSTSILSPGHPLPRWQRLWVINKRLERYHRLNIYRIMNSRALLYQICGQKHIDTTLIDDDGRCLLHIACGKALVWVVAFLLEMGANPNKRDIHGNTALHYIVCNFVNKFPLSLLLAYKACPLRPNDQGTRPLHECTNSSAIQELHVKVLEYGIGNYLFRDKWGRCVLHKMLENDQETIQDMLWHTVINPHATKDDDDTSCAELVIELFRHHNEADVSLMECLNFRALLKWDLMDETRRNYDKYVYESITRQNLAKKDGSKIEEAPGEENVKSSSTMSDNDYNFFKTQILRAIKILNLDAVRADILEFPVLND